MVSFKKVRPLIACPLHILVKACKHCVSLTRCHVGAAKAIFNRARLFVSPHGALCVNMAFMPFGGHLFELRPREYRNACFHHLAEVCELQYYLVMGNGTFVSKIDVDVPPVVKTLRMIKKRMDEEDRGVETNE